MVACIRNVLFCGPTAACKSGQNHRQKELNAQPFGHGKLATESMQNWDKKKMQSTMHVKAKCMKYRCMPLREP